jgi:hypothetical protein
MYLSFGSTYVPTVAGSLSSVGDGFACMFYALIGIWFGNLAALDYVYVREGHDSSNVFTCNLPPQQSENLFKNA